MRIVFLYPPPWKIPQSGHPPYPPGLGSPEGVDPDAVLSGDLIQAPMVCFHWLLRRSTPVTV